MRNWFVGLWFVVCSGSVFSQSLSRAQLTGTWIGVHTEIGPGVYCPLPTYLDLQADGAYRLGLVDESAPARTGTWAVAGDSLQLGSNAYAPGLVTLITDTLRIGTVYPMVFRRFHDVPVDSAVARHRLTNRVWQSDSVTVHLHDNGRVCLENRRTGERTVHHWRLAGFGQSVFLLIQGSEHTTGGRYKPLLQVSETIANQFRATGWHGQSVTTESFRLVRSLSPGDSCRATGFQVCDNCFSQWSSFSGYSFLSLSSRYRIQKISHQYYQPLNLPGQTGVVQVRFVINCAGEMGLFTMRELDDNYNVCAFDTRITEQFSTLCHQQVLRSLTAEATRPDEQRDRAITLNFRLKDGRLTDIYP